MNKPYWKAHLMLLAVAWIYGANYSIAKIILDPGLIGANGFILLRVMAGSLLFVVFFGLPGKIERSDWPGLLFCSFTGVFANQLLFFNGLALTSPIHASLIMICTPIIVMLIRVVQGESMNAVQWIGCFLGFGGAYLVIQSSYRIDGSGATLSGDLMVLLNAVFFGLFLTRAPALISKYGSFELMKWLFLFAIIMCLPFGMVQLSQVDWWNMEPVHWWSMAFVLVCTTFLAYAFNAKALEYSHPSLVSNYIYLQPLIAALIAIWLKKDHLASWHLYSGLMIMTGVYMAGGKLPFDFEKKCLGLKKILFREQE